jgi:peptidoglycan/LPS O-acetylase OafA/YrhL
VDSLRGLAILGVILVHATTCVDNFHGRLRAAAAQGHLGVQLFFIVSAFTLFWSLRSRRSQDRRPLLAFFTRRFFRIAPLFYVAIPVYLACPMPNRPMYAPDGIGWPHVAATLLFVHGWWPTTFNSVVPGDWSIAAEVTFYLCIPFLFARVKTLNAALWLSLLSAVAVGVAVGPVKHRIDLWFPEGYGWVIGQFAQFAFPAQVPVFCMGMALYFVLAEPATPDRPRAGGAVLCAGALATLFAPVSVEALSSLALVVLAIGLARHPVRVIVNPVTRYLGTVSYSAYLWHFWVLEHIRRPVLAALTAGPLHLGPDLQFCGLFLATLLATLPIATASYHLIEQPGQSAGKWLINTMGWGKLPARERPVSIPLRAVAA